MKRGGNRGNFGGGQVDITSGKFVFSAAEAWWVEGGKLQYPVKGATLIGNGPDALTKISMIGTDFAGKYGYVAPEQLGMFGGHVDGKSDVYALGLVLAGVLERQTEELRQAYQPYLALGVADAEDGWVLLVARRR